MAGTSHKFYPKSPDTMTRSPKRQSRLYPSRQHLRRWRSSPDLGLVLLNGGLYWLAGALLTGLPQIAWVVLWPLGLLGFCLQVYGLNRVTQGTPPFWRPDRLGPVLFTGVLASSLNHLGPNQIDRLTLGVLVGQVLLFSLIGFLLAAICWFSTQALHNQLGTAGLEPRRVSQVLRAAGITGLCLGGLGGLILKLL